MAASVEAIGSTEFEEARTVLEHEGYLFPAHGARNVYVEFAAVYLELRFFLPELLAVYFPGIRDHRRVAEVLARDVDAEALSARTRLAGASGPAPRPDSTADEPSDACLQLTRAARQASRAGNTVRAAILRTRAAGIAPAARTLKLREEVRADLDQLSDRLRDALKLTDEETRRVAQGPAGAARQDRRGAVVGRGPAAVRPAQRLLRPRARRLRPGPGRVGAVGRQAAHQAAADRPARGAHHPSPAQRRPAAVVHAPVGGRPAAPGPPAARGAVQQNEERLRGRFRPVLSETLRDVGLVSANAPEQAAFSKVVEELLDRISDFGFFTFSDLRDTLSRNNLKLPDLADPVELRARRPAAAPGPAAGQFAFGRRLPAQRDLPAADAAADGAELRHPPGPAADALRYLAVRGGPAGAGGRRFDPREGHKLFGGAVPAAVRPHLGAGRPAGAGAEGEEPSLPKPSLPKWPFVAPALWVLLGLLALGLFYAPALRRALAGAWARAYRAGRRLLVEWPLRVLPWPALRGFFKSWAFQLVYRLVLKPLPVFLLLWWLFPEAFESWWVRGTAFLAVLVGGQLAGRERPGGGRLARHRPLAQPGCTPAWWTACSA